MIERQGTKAIHLVKIEMFAKLYPDFNGIKHYRAGKNLSISACDSGADNGKIEKIDVCEVSSTVAQTALSLSENAVTQYMSLLMKKIRESEAPLQI